MDGCSTISNIHDLCMKSDNHNSCKYYMLTKHPTADKQELYFIHKNPEVW